MFNMCSKACNYLCLFLSSYKTGSTRIGVSCWLTTSGLDILFWLTERSLGARNSITLRAWHWLQISAAHWKRGRLLLKHCNQGGGTWDYKLLSVWSKMRKPNIHRNNSKNKKENIPGKCGHSEPAMATLPTS